MERVHLESEFRSQPPLGEVQLQEQHSERPREDSRIGEEEMRKFTQQVHAQTTDKLDEFYLRFKRQILQYQSCTLGMFPSIGAKSANRVAYVRDSIYCAMAAWALAQAHRRIDDDKGRTHELGQASVKCMRGILYCWIRQAEKN